MSSIFYWVLSLTSVTILLKLSFSSNDACRKVHFVDYEQEKAHYDHVIAKLKVRDAENCELQCYLNDDCVSCNFGPSETGDDYICELNNSTDRRHLRTRRQFIFQGTKNACQSTPCLNNGKCQHGFTDKTFRCVCPAGFDGELCERDVDDCASGPCRNGGLCNDFVNGYNCSCQSGFTGSHCETDIDECAIGAHNCSVDAWCNNNVGSFSCTCKVGLKGDGTICTGCTLFDFEHGLTGWALTGTAFNNQPTYGDNPTARNRGQPSQHKGDWWIGGYENRPSPSHPAGRTQGDGPQGTLTSPSFVIGGHTFKFLIGGSCHIADVRAELVVEGNVVLQATGGCSESMIERSWDVTGYQNKEAQLRLVDDTSGGWGHINFDHFEEICN
ncbi:hypothetical protein ACROYT_G031360 [Oculina patagonica]